MGLGEEMGTRSREQGAGAGGCAAGVTLNANGSCQPVLSTVAFWKLRSCHLGTEINTEKKRTAHGIHFNRHFGEYKINKLIFKFIHIFYCFS